METQRPNRLLLVMLGLAIVAIGCGGEPDAGDSSVLEPPAGTVDAPPAESPAPEPKAMPELDSAVDPLMDPYGAEMTARAPDRFRVRFDTSKGEFILEVHRDWAPIGADRFFNLVRHRYYDGTRFFRVMDGFVAQFGIHGDPAVSEMWRDAPIQDDPPNEKNTRGRITFAHGGPGTRTVQLFINLGDNLNLDMQGFPPFGEVVEGEGVVESLYSGYGEGAPRGNGPDQGRIQAEGNRYLEREFDRLDYVRTARVVGGS